MEPASQCYCLLLFPLGLLRLSRDDSYHLLPGMWRSDHQNYWWPAGRRGLGCVYVWDYLSILLCLLNPLFYVIYLSPQASQVGGSVVKNLPANSGDTRDVDSIPGSGWSQMTTYSSILAWEIPWTEEPGRLQSMGSQRIEHDLATKQQHEP